MALKIRLRRQGRTNRPFYRLVVTDSRSPRDGKYVETLGWYNPLEEKGECELSLQSDRIEHWLNVGAQPSEKAEQLIARSAPEIVQRFHQKATASRAKQLAKKKEKKRQKTHS